MQEVSRWRVVGESGGQVRSRESMERVAKGRPNVDGLRKEMEGGSTGMCELDRPCDPAGVYSGVGRVRPYGTIGVRVSGGVHLLELHIRHLAANSAIAKGNR